MVVSFSSILYQRATLTDKDLNDFREYLHNTDGSETGSLSNVESANLHTLRNIYESLSIEEMKENAECLSDIAIWADKVQIVDREYCQDSAEVSQ